MRYPVLLLTLFSSCFLITSSYGQDWRKFYTNVKLDKYRSENEKLGSPDKNESRVVLMGNSITEMWPISRPAFFEKTGYIGRGTSGQTTPQMLIRFRTDVISLKPKVVAILAGVNDIAQNTGFTPINIIAENIMSMSEMAQHNGIEVIICSVLPASDFPWKTGLKPANKILELNEILKGYSIKNNIIYLDYHSVMKDDNNGLKVPEYTSSNDLVHPNGAGYEVMELMLEEAVNQALSHSQLKVNSLFTDHMVLQQNEEVNIWGSAPTSAEIKVNASWGKEGTTICNAEGKWSITLKTPDAGGPYDISITSRSNNLTIRDVLIGEVWLASGQSNMSMPLKGWPPNDPILNSNEEIAGATHPNIRVFKVANQYSLKKEIQTSGNWEVCLPENASDFSATAYFFARQLNQELGVPIGIIHSSWGGTPAESWVSSEALKELGDFNWMLEMLSDPKIEDSANEWYDKWEQKDAPSETQDWDTIDLGDIGMAQPDYEDNDWKTLTLPGRIDWHNKQDINGVFWFRKSVYIDDTSLDYTFEMGVVDDTDIVYVNGKRIGGTVYDFTNGRKYKIPKSLLKKGDNSIAIRVVDTGGPGSIGGNILLTTNQGKTVSLEGDWKFMITAELYNNKIYSYDLEGIDNLQRPNILVANAFTATTLYNAMIHPLIPYTIKGSIWYQGESNVGRAEQYERLFPALINDWRSRWKNDFPFYFVQIAPFNYNNGLAPALRDAQRKSLSISKTGMAITMDIGNKINIHPSNKQDVGMRLARLALANDYYGKDLTPTGPLYKDHEIIANKILISFDHLADGLVMKGGTGFEIAGSDKEFVPAEVKIVGDKIEVSTTLVNSPMYVRYAWKDYITGTLFNSDGLPASSFTTLE